MADGVARERRATPCRCDGSDRRHTDHTVDLQKQITALAEGISQLGVILATLTKTVDDKILAKHQQIGRGCEQRRDDRDYSQRHAQRRRHRRHGHSRGRCYGCGQFGHFRRECTRFASEQSREHARASRDSGNVQEIHFTGCASSHLHGGCTTGSRSDGTTTIGHSLATRSLCENVRTDKSYPVTKRLVAYQQGAHVQCDVQRDSGVELEKRRRRATPVSLDKQTQTPTSPNALSVVSVSPRSYHEKPHTIADETSYENPVKHDIIDGGHKRSDERPNTVRSMHPRKAVEVNLKTNTNIETKVDQSYVKGVDWVRIHRNRLCEADELADKQQRIATAKRNARHDVNVTDCTLAIGDVVYIRVRTWRGKFQEIWSPIVHVVIGVPYVGSNVYVVRPATGGPKKTMNRASLLSARPPVTEVDDNAAQEESLSDDEAVLLAPEISTAADPPGIVEAVPTLNKRATWLW